MATAGATGEAKDATVDTGAITPEELAKRQADDKQALEDNVTNAELKVEKMEAHLAAAKEALAAAKAEQKGS
jgi:hypothetical protein